MDEKLRKHLQSHTVVFVEDMVSIKQVVDYLSSKGVLTSAMQEEIWAEKTRGDQARNIHLLMPKRGPKAFDAYYLSLIYSCNNDLARLLKEHVTKELQVSSPKIQLEPLRFKAGGDSPHVQETKFPYVMSPVDDQDETDLPPEWPIIDEEKSFLDVRVKLCDTSSSHYQLMKQKLKQNSVYSMSRNPRGRVVIVNNETFTEPAEDSNFCLASRHGTDCDATALNLVFEQLGFKGNIKTYRDLTREEMLDTLKTEASERPRSDECFVCILLSHGTIGSVYGTDGKKVSISEMTDCFDGSRCPMLVGKPKLFFIQACQGETRDIGSASVPVSGPDSASIKDLTKEFQNLHVVKNTEQADAAVDAPTRADILVATATTPGYVSWRNTQKGSWFIQALVYVLENLTHKYDILTLLTRVNNLVAKNSTLIQGCKQVSEKTDTLTKDFYFFPGLYEDNATVNNLVAKNSTLIQGCKQVSEKTDTLTKDFYFFPGLYEDNATVNNLVAKNSTLIQGCKQVSEKTDTLTKDFYFFPGLYEDNATV